MLFLFYWLYFKIYYLLMNDIILDWYFLILEFESLVGEIERIEIERGRRKLL